MYGALKRGVGAGAVAGVAYGLFVALVATPAIAFAETFEAGHGHGAGIDLASAAPSVVGGALFGLLLGACFGVVYYLLEPALPGASDTRNYLLAAAGFVTVSGAPWLALPPQAPGAEYAFGSDARLAVYAAMMALGALVCALSLLAWRRTEGAGTVARAAAALLPFGLIVVAGVAAPTAPSSGPIPDALATAYRGLVVVGQVLLWTTLATAHVWFLDRTAAPDVTIPSEAPH
ncbi:MULTISPECIES: CbtA family protein [Halostella]|uniref:CbtA family protein n=1 Tax=Halostella TaxID=1843185 RepID=UPI001F0483D5|nr:MULTISPECIES: CbtA family protein [Halostella]